MSTLVKSYYEVDLRPFKHDGVTLFYLSPVINKVEVYEVTRKGKLTTETNKTLAVMFPEGDKATNQAYAEMLCKTLNKTINGNRRIQDEVLDRQRRIRTIHSVFNPNREDILR